MFKKLRQAKREYTKVFFATDIHGSTDCFQKFLSAADAYKCDCLVMGGDITGKMVIPIVEQLDGAYHASFMGNHYSLKDKGEIASFKELINRTGSYPYMTNVDEIKSFSDSGEHERSIEAISRHLMVERLREWMEIIDSRLRDSNIKVFLGPGNDDPFEVDAVLSESTVAVVHDGHVVKIDDHHEMIGLGYANITPWNCPRDIEEDELKKRLTELASQIEDVGNSVFCVHVPPVDSQLDTCFRLNADVYPPALILTGAGRPIPYGAGSVAVREALEEYQPLVALHGHIHESRGRVKIGRTEAFNPGSEYAEGILRGLIVNLTEDGVLGYQFTSG